MAMTPADPMAAINLEKAQIELQRLKDGVDMDPNVQSSAQLPDQSGVVLTMRDGSVQVRTVGGEVLSGQSALDYVRKSQEQAAEYQRSIYGARETGKLEAGAAAAATGTATAPSAAIAASLRPPVSFSALRIALAATSGEVPSALNAAISAS